jgi:hypothetical protein
MNNMLTILLKIFGGLGIVVLSIIAIMALGYIPYRIIIKHDDSAFWGKFYGTYFGSFMFGLMMLILFAIFYLVGSVII